MFAVDVLQKTFIIFCECFIIKSSVRFLPYFFQTKTFLELGRAKNARCNYVISNILITDLESLGNANNLFPFFLHMHSYF